MPSSDITPYFGNLICRWLQGVAMPAAPAGLFLALYDGNPKTSGIEITEDIHYPGRQAFTSTALILGGGFTLLNNSLIDFGLSESVVSLSYAALFDDAGAGNMLASRALPGGPYPISIGTSVKFDVAKVAFIIGNAT